MLKLSHVCDAVSFVMLSLAKNMVEVEAENGVRCGI